MSEQGPGTPTPRTGSDAAADPGDWDLGFLSGTPAPAPFPTGRSASSGNPAWSGTPGSPRSRPLASSADRGGATVTHGLNVRECEDVAAGLALAETDLADIVRAAELSVRTIRRDWDGPDAEKFVATWAAQRGRLDETTESLRRMRQRLQTAIEQQEHASRH